LVLGDIDNVTFVVIGLNESITLGQCFESIKRITNNIVYVDSNSIDGSVEIAEKYGIKKIIKLESNYYSASLGRFVGAKCVKTKYIQFLDGDMTVDREWINLAINKMETDYKIVATLGYKRVYSENFNDYFLLKDEKEYEPDYMGGAFCINTKAYNKIGGFDIRFPAEEERDLYVKIKNEQYKVIYLHSLMASHFDFKSSSRNIFYILNSYRAASIFLPLVNAVKNKMVRSWIEVYKKAIPSLFSDIASIFLIILYIFSFVELGIAVGGILMFQIFSLIYCLKIKRKGYFIIWKSGVINIAKMLKILNRKINYTKIIIK
jgi:glycosyltransferase involved in cell wall biosynthesis